MDHPPAKTSRRWQFTIRAMLFAMLCIAGVLAGFRAGYQSGYQSGHDSGAERLRLETYSTKVYSVPANSASSMVRLIQDTIGREDWSEVGGAGSIRVAPDDPSAIVVLQTGEKHDLIERLLSDLAKSKNATMPPANP